eukprot:IDg17165t1
MKVERAAVLRPEGGCSLITVSVKTEVSQLLHCPKPDSQNSRVALAQSQARVRTGQGYAMHTRRAPWLDAVEQAHIRAAMQNMTHCTPPNASSARRSAHTFVCSTGRAKQFGTAQACPTHLRGQFREAGVEM